jgi:histidine triad (HIT) family protein
VTQPDCLFCKLASGDIPADFVYESDDILAFRDIAPQAPVHILLIPRRHIASIDAAGEDDGALIGSLLLAAAEIAREVGVSEGGYRTVLNTGDDGGQTVHHLHLHLLGGRRLTWPPG